MERPPAIEPELVQAFVANAHGDLERVQELLAREPMLVNAAWDWGGGDWETGLGAAAHMGRRDIALYLLEKGARMDIFAAAMLGHVEHRAERHLLEFGGAAPQGRQFPAGGVRGEFAQQPGLSRAGFAGEAHEPERSG